MKNFRCFKNMSFFSLVVMFFMSEVSVWGFLPEVAPKASGTTINVTTTLDTLKNGDGCSLRQALLAANTDMPYGECPAGSGHDLIIVPAGRYELSLIGEGDDTGCMGDLDILSNITIQGAGPGSTIIDGIGNDRVFHIHDDNYVVLYNLNVTGGNVGTVNGYDGDEGGGILNEGTLLVADCLIDNNSAGDALYYSDRIGTGGFGGALSNYGYLMSFYSTIQENNAGTGAATLLRIGGSGGDGGGFYNHSQGRIYLYDTILQNNRSGSGGLGLVYKGTAGNGGAIANDGQIMLVNCRINGNQTGETSMDSWAGGIYSSGTLLIQDSEISENFAWNGGGLVLNGLSEVKNSTISDNSAKFFGGGIYSVQNATTTLDHCTVAYNKAGFINGGFDNGGGGGLFSEIGHVIIRNSIFAVNMDMSGSNLPSPNISGEIMVDNKNLFDDSAGFTITGNTYEQLLNVDAMLKPLLNNGGFGRTHGLLIDSPALDVLSCQGEDLDNDQRGAARPDAPGKKCDLGAFELTNNVELVLDLTESVETVVDEPFSIDCSVVNEEFGTITDVYLRAAIPSNLAVISAEQSHGFCCIVKDGVICQAQYNALVNPGAEEGTLSGWQIIGSWPQAWTVTSGDCYQGDSCFLVSDHFGQRFQLIDLVAAGLTEEFLDAAPRVEVGEYIRGSDGPLLDGIYIVVKLLDGQHNIIASWNIGTPQKLVRAEHYWDELRHIFNYQGPGLRYISFEDGGIPGNSSAGINQSGPAFDNAFVRIEGAALNPEEVVSMSVTLQSCMDGTETIRIQSTARDSLQNDFEVTGNIEVTSSH